MNDTMHRILADSAVPSIDEPNEFMDKIDELESLITELQMENKDLENFFEGAMQSYLDANCSC